MGEERLEVKKEGQKEKVESNEIKKEDKFKQVAEEIVLVLASLTAMEDILGKRSTFKHVSSGVAKILRREFGEALKEARRDGIRLAAGWASEWDGQICGTPYMFEDIILGKMNLKPKNKMRKKRQPDPRAKLWAKLTKAREMIQEMRDHLWSENLSETSLTKKADEVLKGDR